MDAVDKAKPGTAIVWDEMVLGGLAQDASSEAQKVLIKKLVTIRKKRLYLFFVLPSIFMLRLYFAVFRTRALIHFTTPDGIQRGIFKFYSYDTKRKLFMKGRKEYDQDASKPDFMGDCTNTMGYFFDLLEYDSKKEEAIKSITAEKTKPKLKKIMNLRDVLLLRIYNEKRFVNMDEFAEWIIKEFGQEFKIANRSLSDCLKKARELLDKTKGTNYT